MKKVRRVMSRSVKTEPDPARGFMLVLTLFLIIAVTANTVFVARLEQQVRALADRSAYQYRYNTGGSADGAEKDERYGAKKYIGATSVFEWPAAGDRLAELEEGPGHPGVNIYCVPNAGISASDGGTVIYAGELENYGKTVIVRHTEGCCSLYEFCGELLAHKGDEVNKGDCIARAGGGSMIEPPHCHFCLSVDGEFIDPSFYIENGLPPKSTNGRI